MVSFYVTRYPEKEGTDRQQTAHCGVTDLQCDPHMKHHVVVGKTLVYMEPAQSETAFSHVVHDVQVAVLLKLLLWTDLNMNSASWRKVSILPM